MTPPMLVTDQHTEERRVVGERMELTRSSGHGGSSIHAGVRPLDLDQHPPSRCGRWTFSRILQTSLVESQRRGGGLGGGCQSRSRGKRRLYGRTVAGFSEGKRGHKGRRSEGSVWFNKYCSTSFCLCVRREREGCYRSPNQSLEWEKIDIGQGFDPAKHPTTRRTESSL